MHDVVVVGAGFGGLGAAIQLRRAGIDDVVVLERSDEVGGTWSANTYPGAQCDVPSNLYSFSFAPRPDWSHSYPEQPQILDYLKDCAERFGVMDRIRLGCELLGAEWDEGERCWRIATSEGELSARVLIAAPGLLSEPAMPAVGGLDRFEGTAFHSARWDHGHDLRGRRVAVVGTGASATQIVPRIQPLVERLHVVQRTPPWVLGHPDREIGERLKRQYRRVPGLQRLARYYVYWLRELLGACFVSFSPLMKFVEVNARIHLHRQVRDRELRRRLTPSYAVGCKRVLLSDDWYPALQAPNVELHTEGLAELRERSIVLAGGAEREVDTVIFGTGFTPTNPPIARRLTGRGGATLAEVWEDGMRAHLGTTVAGFPNLFLLWGPNTNLAHTSVVFMIEAQVHYVVEALRAMRSNGWDEVEVRREAQQAWVEDVQRRLGGKVWNTGGCASWYLDARGENPIMWPGQTFSYRRRLRSFDPGEYLTHAAAREGRAAATAG